jgi:hypothetical protein
VPIYAEPVEPTTEALPVAQVTYPSLRGTQDLQIFDGDVVTFGRGGNCRIRFGHAPTLDLSIPRIAGTIVAIDSRLVVNSPTHVGHRALEIHVGHEKSQIPIGQGVSLCGNFDIVVRGESRIWLLNVHEQQRLSTTIRGPDEDPSTAQVKLNLTPIQWKVLRAYVEPILRGGSEPATHQEVAQDLGFHLNTVRNKLYEIRDLMYINGLQMLDTHDARVAVVQAARIHGLIKE